MLEPRSNFSVAILNNQLLVMGGMDADGRDCNRVDIYCPATNRFFLPSHLLTRYVLSNVFVFASRWSRGPELLTARSALACVPVPRGEFL